MPSPLLAYTAADLRAAIPLLEERERLKARLEELKKQVEALGGEVGNALVHPKPKRTRKRFSAATRAKMRASAKKRWDAKKAQG